MSTARLPYSDVEIPNARKERPENFMYQFLREAIILHLVLFNSCCHRCLNVFLNVVGGYWRTSHSLRALGGVDGLSFELILPLVTALFTSAK